MAVSKNMKRKIIRRARKHHNDGWNMTGVIEFTARELGVSEKEVAKIIKEDMHKDYKV